MALLNRVYSQTRRLSARSKALVTLALLLAVGAGLNLLNVPVASSAANSVEVVHINQAAPTDPQDQVWNSAKESEIPLSAQEIYQPGGGTTRAVRVKALEDGQTFSIMVSWDDDTRNDTQGQSPSDAVAIQMPLDPSHLPYQCMGQSTSRVNIWQWKAALEKEARDTQQLTQTAINPVSTLAVRNYTSNGICRAVDTPGIDPQAKSYHDGKQWHVVFWRLLSKGDAGSAPLTRDASTSIAFAVWNGAHGEARGMKSVSTWNTLTFQAPPGSSLSSFITLGVILAVSAGAVAWAMRRFSRS